LGSVSIESIDRCKVIDELQACARNIGMTYRQVEVCLLYGSLLRGDYSPESDIDFLIVLQTSTLPFLQRGDQFHEFFLQLPFDVDLKVYTRKEIESMLEENNLFIVQAFKEGKVLWSMDERQNCTKY
jgi:predicted nucleotidyltransferase